jgi:hypothetical protein
MRTASALIDCEVPKFVFTQPGEETSDSTAENNVLVGKHVYLWFLVWTSHLAEMHGRGETANLKLVSTRWKNFAPAFALAEWFEETNEIVNNNDFLKSCGIASYQQG